MQQQRKLLDEKNLTKIYRYVRVLMPSSSLLLPFRCRKLPDTKEEETKLEVEI